MGYTYEDVLALLGPTWGETRPPMDQVNKALKAGQTPEQIAAALTAYVKRFSNPPKGYEYQDAEGVWNYKLFYAFGGGSKFGGVHANIALGFSEPDPELPKVPPAFTEEDAWAIALLGWYRQGHTRFLDMTTDDGKAKMAHRLAFAEILPPSWAGVDHGLYRYFVISNRVPSEPVPFGVRQSETARQFQGFTLQKFLDNEWARDEMLPAPWGPGGVPQ